jgi:hypothetical protein
MRLSKIDWSCETIGGIESQGVKPITNENLVNPNGIII